MGIVPSVLRQNGYMDQAVRHALPMLFAPEGHHLPVKADTIPLGLRGVNLVPPMRHAAVNPE